MYSKKLTYLKILVFDRYKQKNVKQNRLAPTEKPTGPSTDWECNAQYLLGPGIDLGTQEGEVSCLQQLDMKLLW